LVRAWNDGPDIRSVTSADRACRVAINADPSTVNATPWAPPPIETVRPATRSSAITGHEVVEPNGVMVPRS
jgi:hypothetical protein